MDGPNPSIQIISTALRSIAKSSAKSINLKEALEGVDISLCKLALKDPPENKEEVKILIESFIYLSNLIHTESKENCHKENKLKVVLERVNLVNELCKKRLQYYQN